MFSWLIIIRKCCTYFYECYVTYVNWIFILRFVAFYEFMKQSLSEKVKKWSEFSKLYSYLYSQFSKDCHSCFKLKVKIVQSTYCKTKEITLCSSEKKHQWSIFSPILYLVTLYKCSVENKTIEFENGILRIEKVT